MMSQEADFSNWLVTANHRSHNVTFNPPVPPPSRMRSAWANVSHLPFFSPGNQEDLQQRESHMRWGDGFIIVYDITDRGSFEDVAPLRSLLEDVKKPKNVPLVLVGNKCDLDHARQVGTEEGERLAAEMACAFYECSACADEGGAVAEAFHEVCREVRRRKAVQGKARRRSSTTHVKQAINKMLTKISS